MYENYYSLKKFVIIEGLKIWKNEKKRVAVWGAGKRGMEFLKIYDNNRTYIDYVFDIDLNKCGYILPSGHKVYDYRDIPVDIVLFIDPQNTNESVMKYRSFDTHASICCIENIIFGDMTLQESLEMKMINGKKEHAEIYAVTILYRPSSSIVKNIRTYLPFVKQLYLYDNSPDDNRDMLSEILKDSRIIYIWKDGKNNGIGKPINEIAHNLPINSHSWLITFDQDSMACSEMIKKMRTYVESDIYDYKAGVVAPLAKNLFQKNYNDEMFQQLPYLTYKQEVMQSGAMHRLDVLDNIGGYNEELFIDQVDCEYCARCRINGYRIVQLNNSLMIHQTDDENQVITVDGKTRTVNKYSPERYYYQFRNQLYMAKKYKEIDPIYSERCIRNFYNLKESLCYETSQVVEKLDMLHKAENDAKLGNLGKYEK